MPGENEWSGLNRFANPAVHREAYTGSPGRCKIFIVVLFFELQQLASSFQWARAQLARISHYFACCYLEALFT
jgi:hypothetical protein